MDKAQKVKGKVFKDLHSAEGIFVMPNGWNAGSDSMLEEGGFPAVGTTSAGISFCWGSPTMRECFPGKRRWSRLVGLPARLGQRSAWTPRTAMDTPRRRSPRPSVGRCAPSEMEPAVCQLSRFSRFRAPRRRRTWSRTTTTPARRGSASPRSAGRARAKSLSDRERDHRVCGHRRRVHPDWHQPR